MRKSRILALSLLILLNGLGAIAADDRTKSKLPEGYVESADAIVTGNATPAHMALAAQYMVNHDYFDKAIALCQKALRKDDNDADIHKIYAEALEGKLRHDKKDNPDLFQQCLKEWLIVLRYERGPEKGMTFRGIGIPGLLQANEDEDHSMEARMHLVDLTGTSPRAWETDGMYVKRASRIVGTAVSAKLLSSDKAKTFEAPDNDINNLSAPVAAPAKRKAAPSSEDALDWLKQ